MKNNYITIKAIIIAKVIELISCKYKLSLSDARDAFYESETIKLIEDNETGLYGESPLYSFSIYQKERDSK